MNKSGQTALEIADFWNQSAILHLLMQDTKQNLDKQRDGRSNYFGFNPLDRCANKRTDKDWLEKVTKDADTKFLLFADSSPYVYNSEGGGVRLCLFSYSQVAPFLTTENPPAVVLLGVGSIPPMMESTVGNSAGHSASDEQSAWFALDVSGVVEEEVQKISSDAQLMSLKNPLAMMSLQDTEAGIVAQAR